YIYRENNFFIIDKGRNDNELAVVKVCNGAYHGFGYIDKEDVDNKVLLNASIKPYADNKDVQVIIKGYLRKYLDVKIIKF
ncbi:MAG: exonuclease, partial [Bacteroidota bacterium]